MRTLLSIVSILVSGAASGDWFENLKDGTHDEDLYRVLYYMPKGGDLHNHLSGSNFSEWYFDLALQQAERGYQYYTKVRIDNCIDFGSDEYGRAPYYLMFRNISALEYAELNTCEQGEYKALANLDKKEKSGWLNSLRLDKPWEGREEFFGTHWHRLNALLQNPWLQAETLILNMQDFADEGVVYFEPQVAVTGFVRPNGAVIPPEEVIEILRARLEDADARATGVTVRMQIPVLRFSPDAEEALRQVYKIVAEHDDLFVAINLVGREDNDKGYPLRFLPALRELRREYSGVRLSIHAGEVDEPNYHVRDTLLLGAERIGHGLNLISDDATMRLMRHGPYLVEINLISNLLLNYVSDYDQHPFPEYLRLGIPVALSTDDRGMWDSNMTDEFFVAVKEFDLSWTEVKRLSRYSLQHAFLEEHTKQTLLEQFDERLANFEARMQKYGLSRLGEPPKTRRFICTRYDICVE